MLNLKKIADGLLKLYNENGGWLSESKIQTYVEQNKLTYISKGRGRVACIIDDKQVVKFALGEFGLECNKREYENYHKIADEEKNNYIQIYKHGKQYQYLLVERVVPNIGKDEMNVPAHMMRKIEDSCTFNFGRRMTGKGRYGYKWVVLDYAEYM